jgi:hypothetical protein
MNADDTDPETEGKNLTTDDTDQKQEFYFPRVSLNHSFSRCGGTPSQ